MNKYHQLLKETESDIESGKIDFTGYAFVTFRFEHEAKLALDTILRPDLHSLWTELKQLLFF